VRACFFDESLDHETDALLDTKQSIEERVIELHTLDNHVLVDAGGLLQLV